MDMEREWVYRKAPVRRAQTERGEAMADTWNVLWTRSHCEQLVSDQLGASGFEVFLPKAPVWSRRAGQRRQILMPLFPGYLFLRHDLDKAGYLAVRQARGLVAILGEGWERPATVPDRDVEAIRAVLNAGTHALPHPYLREGQRVRITRGPLAEIEGILTQIRAGKGLLVLSIDLLRRSVAVEVDSDCVEPIAASGPWAVA